MNQYLVEVKFLFHFFHYTYPHIEMGSFFALWAAESILNQGDGLSIDIIWSLIITESASERQSKTSSLISLVIDTWSGVLTVLFTVTDELQIF